MNPDEFSVKQLIHSYVMSFVNTDMDSTNAKNIDYMRSCAEKDLYELTRSEIINDLTESEKQKMSQQIKQEAARLKANSVSKLLIESGLLALLIGLFVNQLTNFINLFVPLEYQTLGTIILCLIFLGLIFIVFNYLILSSITKVLNLGDVNESDES